MEAGTSEGEAAHPHQRTTTHRPSLVTLSPYPPVIGMKHMRVHLTTLAVVLSVLLPLALNAQTNGIQCNSTSSVSPALLRAASEYHPGRGTTRYVKVKVIIASQLGPGGDASTPSIVQRDLDGMNGIFADNNTDIQFELCGPVQVVDNDALYALWNLSLIHISEPTRPY